MPLSNLSAPPPEAIRTLALVGPAGTGKTTLAEALLLAAGAIQSAGSVERGSTVADTDPLARKHQHSLNSALLHLAHRDTRVHLADTPGLPDFVGPALTALEAVETAVVLVNAAVGVEPGTRRMMEAAAQRGLDRLIVVNRIDTPGVDLADLLAELRETFGKEVLPLNLPANGGQEVVDCWFEPAAQPGHEADFSSVATAHRALVEQVVEVDAAFVERYLEDGDVDARELHGSGPHGSGAAAAVATAAAAGAAARAGKAKAGPPTAPIVPPFATSKLSTGGAADARFGGLLPTDYATRSR